MVADGVLDRETKKVELDFSAAIIAELSRNHEETMSAVGGFQKIKAGGKFWGQNWNEVGEKQEQTNILQRLKKAVVMQFTGIRGLMKKTRVQAPRWYFFHCCVTTTNKLCTTPPSRFFAKRGTMLGAWLTGLTAKNTCPTCGRRWSR